MKFFVITLALIGVAVADVSHLNLGQSGYSYGAASASSSSSGHVALPGGDSSSYQPAHLIPQHLKASHAASEIIPGGDSSSYQPEHLIPQHLKAAHVESASAEIIPGGDSSSYQPEHLIPQHLKASHVYTSQSFNIGADTHTPEQFIPEADRIAHAEYVQQQTHVVPGGDSSSYQPAHLIPQHLKASHVESASAEVIPGGDSSSYQPEHLIPQHLKASHVESASAEVIPGGDSSSYQPEHLIPQHLRASHVSTSQSINIGADTHTPEQFIPEADRIAHYNYIHTQTQTVIPGGDSSSYQPQQQQSISVSGSINLGADTQTPEQFIPEADRIAHAAYVQQQEQAQLPTIIGANTITPAHLYQEQTSNGIEEFNAETHVPTVIGRDTVTPAHLLPKYSAGHDTQYGSNGGYVY